MSAVDVSPAPAAQPEPVAAPRRASLPARAGKLLVAVLQRVWLAALAVVAWELAAEAASSPFFPPPSAILDRLATVWFGGPASQLFLSEAGAADLGASVQRLALGWAIAALLGIGLGLAIGLSPVFRELTAPLVTFGLSVPATTLVPLAVVMFGITSGMNVALIVFGCVWGILINTVDGVLHVDPTAMQTARSLRLSRRRRLTRVVLPAAAPQIAAGLRVSLGIALVLVVVSELYAARSGVGYALAYAQRTFRFLDMWSAIVVLAALGLLANGLFALVERRALRWHTESRRTSDQA